MRWYVLSVFILVGCSGASPTITPAPYRDTPLNQNADPQAPRPIPYEATEARAAGALIEQGIRMLVDKKKAPERTIEGQCRVRSTPESTIYLPCQNVQVVLLDSKTQEVGRSNTEGGRFSFTAKSGERYQIKIVSKIYKLAKDLAGTVKERDIVSIELTSATR